MRLPEFSAHRSAVATAGAIAAVVAVVTGVAVVSGGYAAQRVDLGDAAVWVVNDAEQAVGRANTAVLELNSVIVTPGDRAEVVQQGSTVLVLDRDRATVDVVDATTSTITKSVAVPPPEDTAVAIAGDRVVVAPAGTCGPHPSMPSPTSTAMPIPSSRSAPERDVRRSRRRPLRLHPVHGRVAGSTRPTRTVAARWQLPPAEDDPEVQITSVDEHWVVLDETSLTLWIEGREVDLAGVLEPTTTRSCRPHRSTADRSPSRIAAGCSRSASTAVRPWCSPTTSRVIRPRRSSTTDASTPRGPARRFVPAPGRSPAVWSSTGHRVRSARFLVNGDTLVLNDPGDGNTWAASDDYRLIDNWDVLLRNQRNDKTIEQNDPETEPTIEKTQVPPVAVDDEFGARPGRSTLLPVLLEDYDANGDVLVVDGVDGQLPPGARIDLVSTTSCS
jgi:hypothetical protein